MHSTKINPTELYSMAQWKWISARWIEGYSLTILGEWLGLSAITLRNMIRETVGGKKGHSGGNGFIFPIEDLEERKAEFNALWEEE